MVACAVLLAPAGVQAAFPGANGKIVFSSDRAAQYPSFLGREMFTMNPDGTGLVQLTDGTGQSRNDSDPTWSPDGRKIAFTRGDMSGAGTGKFVYVMNADGSAVTQVPNTGLNAAAPAWSPDGTRIAFANARGTQCGNGRNECTFDHGGYDIYTVRLDGSELTRLTPNFRDDLDPAWSPDGTRIAFAGSNIGGVGVSFIYMMNSDGTGQTRITTTVGTAGDFHPNWSPDGQRIVFHSDRPPHDGGSRIWVINADGSNATRVSNGPGLDRVPVWSPDGNRLAFTSSLEPDGYRVYTTNVDGTARVRLTDHQGQYDFDSDWQPAPVGNRPPSCSDVTVTPGELTPADRGLRLVSVDGASDPDGDAVAVAVTGVTQDESLTDGEDKTSPDAFSNPDNEPNEVYLRAERRNGRDGRVYRVAFIASDFYGAHCSGTGTVSVRRKADRPAVDSAPPSYDSFGP